MTSSATIHDCSLEYLRRNWSVIPLRYKDKRPSVRWQEFQHRRPSVEDIKSWQTRWSTINLGIVTGIISGIVVVDIDPKHSGDDSLASLEESNSDLPKTVEAITGGGGHHLYFTHPGGVIHNKVGLAPGIDIRGDGGFVVAPPSMHVSGARYSWAPGHSPEQIELMPLPEWLLTMITGEDRRAGHSRDHWCNLVKQPVAEGERKKTIVSMADHLLWHGVDPDIVMEMLLCWNKIRCNPPLAEEDVVKTVEGTTRTHEG